MSYTHLTWLLSGKEKPFPTTSGTLWPAAYLALIEQEKREKIFMLRSTAPTGKAGIIIQRSEWDFTVISRTYHISDIVGHTGEQQIESFYQLSDTLHESWATSPRSLTVEHDLFMRLFDGEEFPGVITEPRTEGIKYDEWADDLRDYEHKYPIAQYYAMWYGEGFIAAQRILRDRLSSKDTSNDLPL